MADSKNVRCDKKTADKSRPFFEQLAGRVEQLKQSVETSPRIYHLEIAGHGLQLCFLNTDMNDYYAASLGYVLRKTPAEPEDIFYIWLDRISDYVPDICDGNRRWFCHGDEATITGSFESGYVSARHHDTNITYLCMSSDHAYGNVFTSHPFVNEMNWWARAHGLFLVHSASAGIDGKGVLISAFGGSGKTTLALACLLHGMEYVADDYLLLDQNKCRMAYPIYSTGYMLPDSLELLPQLKKYALGRNSEKKNKTIIDLSQYFSQFAPSMDIKAIVLPVVSDHPEPSVERIPSTQPMMQMVYSTARQNREEKNAGFIRGLFECIKGLPTYRINLSRNVFENAALIKKLVNELQ